MKPELLKVIQQQISLNLPANMETLHFNSDLGKIIEDVLSNMGPKSSLKKFESPIEIKYQTIP
jgi:hypothetical protein